MIDTGIFILRLILGLIFIAHGSQKLLGWFGGAGLKETMAGMGRMGMRPSWFWGTMAAISEFGGGLLVLLGFLNPLGSLGIIAAMLVAIVKVHWNKGFWNTKGGFEFLLINLTAALALAITGPGQYSLDQVLNTTLPEPLSLLLGLVLVILSVIVLQASRTRTPAPRT